MYFYLLVLIPIHILDTNCHADADRDGHRQDDFGSDCNHDSNNDRPCNYDRYCDDGCTYDCYFGLGADPNYGQGEILFL
jgi:hypothetical protein